MYASRNYNQFLDPITKKPIRLISKKHQGWEDLHCGAIVSEPFLTAISEETEQMRNGFSQAIDAVRKQANDEIEEIIGIYRQRLMNRINDMIPSETVFWAHEPNSCAGQYEDGAKIVDIVVRANGQNNSLMVFAKVKNRKGKIYEFGLDNLCVDKDDLVPFDWRARSQR